MKLIYRGAEADLHLGNWSGRQAIFKKRKRLTYRLRELDDAVRTQRTLHEAQMLHRAKRSRVRTPFLYHVERAEALIVMEYVDGERLKERVSTMAPSERRSIFRRLGIMAAHLHGSGIMHGDLTTSNVLVNSGELVLVDFGLSLPTMRIEDHAVDLRLIKETLTGAHASIAGESLNSLFEGYREVAGDLRFRVVERQLRQIERRGRYARVD